MEAFLGSWKLESNEGLSELLVRLGAGVLSRTTMNNMKPLMIIAREKGPGDPEFGEVFSMKTQTRLKSVVCNFRMGYAFDETTMDGRTVRTLFTMDGETLKQEQRGTKTTYITYNIEKDTLKMVIQLDDLTCIRTFKRAMRPHSTMMTTKSKESTPGESTNPTSPSSPENVKNTEETTKTKTNGVLK
nr:fatty acid binding protein FABP2 [Hymenolepis microstoma]